VVVCELCGRQDGSQDGQAYHSGVAAGGAVFSNCSPSSFSRGSAY